MEAQQFSIMQDADGTYRFKGEITIHNIEHLKNFLDTTVDRAKRIFINMTEVTYADTASLQLLIAFRKKVRKAKLKWKIREISPELDTILEISGLKKHLM